MYLFMTVYRAAFAVFDGDGDGRITASELGAVIRQVGDECEPKQLMKMIAEVDKNGLSLDSIIL